MVGSEVPSGLISGKNLQTEWLGKLKPWTAEDINTGRTQWFYLKYNFTLFSQYSVQYDNSK